MMIREAIRDDHGLFTIRVENAHGFATASCEVNVLGRFLYFMEILSINGSLKSMHRLIYMSKRFRYD